MFLRVEDMLTVSGQPFSQMDVIGVASEAGSVVGYYFDGPFFYFFRIRLSDRIIMKLVKFAMNKDAVIGIWRICYYNLTNAAVLST
jgi:hypothetical protein